MNIFAFDKQKSSVQTIKADFLKVVKINADLTFN